MAFMAFSLSVRPPSWFLPPSQEAASRLRAAAVAAQSTVWIVFLMVIYCLIACYRVKNPM